MLHSSLAAMLLTAHALGVPADKFSWLLHCTERGESVDLYARMADNIYGRGSGYNLQAAAYALGAAKMHMDIETRMLDAIRGRPIGLVPEIALPYGVLDTVVYVTPRGRIEWPGLPDRESFGSREAKTFRMNLTLGEPYHAG